MAHTGRDIGSLSFEFFPPATAAGDTAFENALTDLTVAKPSFVSITYGAGGSTRDRTRDLVLDVCANRPFPAVPHLTCVGHDRSDIAELLTSYEDGGVETVLALAGDPPADGSPAAGDFTYALELVELIRDTTNLGVAVAAHPEVHPRSTDRASDRQHLAAKLALADYGLSQFFFHVDDYLRLIDELDALGTTTPVIPGVIPVLNPSRIRHFAEMNGAKVPVDLWTRLEEADQIDREKFAVEACVEFCAALLDEGVPGLHFYTLNQSPATLAILTDLGIVAN